MSIFNNTEKDIAQATQQIMDANVNGFRLEYTGPIVWRRYFRAPTKEFKGLDRIVPVVNNIEITNKQNSIETGNRNTLINYEGNYDNDNF